MRTLHTLALVALALAPATALAAPETWVADPAHTHIGFSVRHMMVSNVKGEFAKYDVKVAMDPKDPTKSTVEVTIDAASIDTGNAKRDTHLKSADFFDVAKFPRITFKSKKIVKAGKGAFKVYGDLTIKGTTKEVVLQVKNLVGPVKDPWGNPRTGLEATTTVDRRDFGLRWNKALEAGGVLVGNDVKIGLEVEMVPATK